MGAGTLVDDQIIERAERGELIAEGFDRSRVKQACYELRTSSTYYDLDEPERPINLEVGETILIKPKQLVVVITEEKLDLPPSVLGRVLSKGQLFSLGLVPVNTYADPGFRGRLGIVLLNSSNDYLALPQLTPVAKIEFVDLGREVGKAYSGQHGYETEIWPIAHQFRLTAAEIEKDPRIGSPHNEVRRAYGDDVGRVVTRVFGYQRRLLLFSAIYGFILVGVVALNFLLEDRLNTWVAVIIGLVTNAVFGILLWLATSLSRKRR